MPRTDLEAVHLHLAEALFALSEAMKDVRDPDEARELVETAHHLTRAAQSLYRSRDARVEDTGKGRRITDASPATR